MAYVNSTPSGFVNISPAPEPSIQDDPSVNKVHGSSNSSGSAMSLSRNSSSSRSMIKSANIYPLSMSLLTSGPRRARLTKYTRNCLPPLSVIKTALIASLAAAKYMISSSFSFGAVSIGSSAMSFFICLKATSASCEPLKSLFLCAFSGFFEERQHPRDGRHPSRTFRRCSAMFRGTPVISAGFQEKTSRMNGHFYLLVQHLTGHGVLCACPGDHCIFHRDDSAASYRYRSSFYREFSSYQHTVPPFTRYHGDLVYNHEVHATAKWNALSSPIFTSRDIWPIGQMVSPLNPMSDVVAGIIYLLVLPVA
ncbi:hypothetical protein Tco_1143067 [Tanacetum coccineum]